MDMVTNVAALVQSHKQIRRGSVSSAITPAADFEAENAAGRMIMLDMATTPQSRDLFLWLLDLMSHVVMRNHRNKMNSWVSRNLMITRSVYIYI